MSLERLGNMKIVKMGWPRGPEGLGLREDTIRGVKTILRTIIPFLELKIES